MKRSVVLLLLLLIPAFVSADEITVQNAARTRDGTIRENFSTYNYGASTDMQTVNSSGIDRKFFIMFTNLADTLGAGIVVDSFYVMANCNSVSGSNTIVGVSGVFKPYYEGVRDHAEGDSATWNGWHAADSAWGTAGANNASDAGSPNRTAGGGYDRFSTPFASATFSGSGTVTWAFNAAGISWINDIVSGSISPDQAAMVFMETSTVGICFFSTREGATCPSYRAVYHATGTGPTKEIGAVDLGAVEL